MTRRLVTGAMILAAVAAVTLVEDSSVQASPAGLVLTRHMVVESSSLPHCTVEDGSSGPLPCTWNVQDDSSSTEVDGNGAGLAYWVGRQGHTGYVWPADPRRNGWHWPRRERQYPFAAVVRDGHYKLPNGKRGVR